MRQLQENVDEAIASTGRGYFSPLANVARICEEAGELARIVNHHFGDKPKKSGEAEQDLGEEIGDLIFAAICLLNSRGLDLQPILESVVAKCAGRDRERFAEGDSET
ncbi:MAG: nucleotide pyrophosphohydrolase [Planctomycetota bacterium]